MKLFAIGAILLLPVLALGSTFVQTKQMALPAGDINKLSVQCGAGSLYIINVEGQDTIRVFAEIEVDNLNNSAHQGFADKKSFPRFLLPDGTHLTKNGNLKFFLSLRKCVVFLMKNL